MEHLKIQLSERIWFDDWQQQWCKWYRMGSGANSNTVSMDGRQVQQQIMDMGSSTEILACRSCRTNVAIYGSATGGAINWGLHIDNGDARFDNNVGIVRLILHPADSCWDNRVNKRGVKFPDGTILISANITPLCNIHVPIS